MTPPRQAQRRQFCAALASSVALPALLPLRALAADTALPVPASLPRIAMAAAAKDQPVVLLVSLPGCPYCELVRRNYLLPARQDVGLQAWQLSIADRTTPLIGFDGKASTAAAQIKAWKATFTPTVLFLGESGQELAERLVGVGVPDFYGAYLEQRLAAARKTLAARG
ncbi:thioredoxin family protein [Polaromonas sp. P1(28)-8]|nr:thioredoxin family protein [Polaromonas sp. P1(28)-8]